jgi:hypothetical protein
MKITVLVPTKDRPSLLEESLRFLSLSSELLHQIIVSDSSNISGEQNRTLCIESKLNNLCYWKQESNLSAVAHWDRAVRDAEGDFIICLTDKMLLLPSTIYTVLEVIKNRNVDIINWKDLSVSLIDTDYHFDNLKSKNYLSKIPGDFSEFSPLDELEKKSLSAVHRSMQSKESYVRGKICFGGYSRWLIEELIKKSGSVCSGATLDYSSMVKALGNARTAFELTNAGVLHNVLPLKESTGSRITHFSKFAREYVESLQDKESVLKGMLIPDLYVSSTNLISYDFLNNLRYSNRTISFNEKNWITDIAKDLALPNRVWENSKTRQEQFSLFTKFVFVKTQNRVLLKSHSAALINLTYFKYWFFKILRIKLPVRQFYFIAQLNYLQKNHKNFYLFLRKVLVNKKKKSD